MATQNGWIEAWKSKAAGRRQVVTERLSRKPANPFVESLWTRYLQRAEDVVNFRQGLAQAYASHLQGLSQIIGGAIAGVGVSPSSKKRGSLGD